MSNQRFSFNESRFFSMNVFGENSIFLRHLFITGKTVVVIFFPGNVGLKAKQIRPAMQITLSVGY